MNFHGVNRARNTLSVGACRSRSVLVYSATFLSAPRMCQRDAKHIPFLVLNRSRILYQPAVRLKSLCKSTQYESRNSLQFSNSPAQNLKRRIHAKTSRFTHPIRLLVLASLLSAPALLAAFRFVPSTIQPPVLVREFRGAWVATVGNIDWPSKAGLSSLQQKAELIAILDRAVHLRLNAIILQVRPGCDAFYASKLEPWSEYLTGQMGRAPSPFYDPLGFAVQEAHRRGLELHAWFNPFRARHTKALSPVAPNHISRTHPEWVRSYGSQLWLDPGEDSVQAYCREVILDVVRRYDIDAVHLDDYFYPYPEYDARKQPLAFPDAATWKRYAGAGGKFSREDWRRDNVDRFIQQLYQSIKAEKPFVKFGVSPFGIWRPGFPPQIKGFDAYEGLFADSRKWLACGWVDYLAPQLYWSIEPKEQSYPVLLQWWAEQNLKQRHLWPGDAPNRIGINRSAPEILNQIRLTRQQASATGNIHWSISAFMRNRDGIGDALLKEIYAQPALVPASPWLDSNTPSAPKIAATNTGADVKITWENKTGKQVWLWVLQTKTGKEWSTEILPSHQTTRLLTRTPRPDALALTAVDRVGNASRATVLEMILEGL